MEKQRWEESEKRREEKKKEDQKRERVRRKKMQVREKVEKSRKTLFFPMICETAERKVRTTEDITKMRKKQMRGSTEGSLYSMSHEIMHGLTRMLFWGLICGTQLQSATSCTRLTADATLFCNIFKFPSMFFECLLLRYAAYALFLRGQWKEITWWPMPWINLCRPAPQRARALSCFFWLVHCSLVQKWQKWPGMDVFVTRAMVFDIISFVYATCAIDRCTHMGFIYIYTPVTNTHMKKDPEMILQEIMALERWQVLRPLMEEHFHFMHLTGL